MRTPGPANPRERLLELLPEDGTPKTNRFLRNELGLSEDQYWEVRNSLLEQGIVTKLRGRGGRSARVVDLDSTVEQESKGVLAWLPTGVFLLSVVCLFLALGYLIWWRESPNWQWNLSTLIFGAVTVAAVGVSLLIFRLQSDMDRAEANDQGLIFARLEKLAHRTVASSEDTRDFVRRMQPAQEAALSDVSEDAPSEPAAIDLKANGSPSPAADFSEDSASEPITNETDVIRRDGAEYYRPPQVPVRVLADLVSWWQREGETGRWTIGNLVGGYRKLNTSGGFQGMPWILTFKDSSGNYRNYRIAYSGAGKGPAVSEHTQGAGWQNLTRDAGDTAL